MCTVCQHPDRIAIEAAIQAGRPLRALAADYPGLNKSTIGRHRRNCMVGEPVGTSFDPGCNGEDRSTPQSQRTVRLRTRAQIDDEESRLRTVMLLRAEGRTHVEIARRLGIHPSTVREAVSRAHANALERVRAQTVEELIALRMVELQARARNLARLQEEAEARNDVRTQLDIARLKFAESKEHREWMRELGAFDSFRIKTQEEQQQSGGHSPDNLIHMFKELVTSCMSLNDGDDLQEQSLAPTGTTY